MLCPFLFSPGIFLVWRKTTRLLHHSYMWSSLVLSCPRVLLHQEHQSGCMQVWDRGGWGYARPAGSHGQVSGATRVICRVEKNCQLRLHLALSMLHHKEEIESEQWGKEGHSVLQTPCGQPGPSSAASQPMLTCGHLLQSAFGSCGILAF